MSDRFVDQWLTACGLLAPVFSTCSRRQYFAVVVGTDKRVVGVGYNGSPAGMAHCTDGGCPRGVSNVPHGSSYEGDGFCVAQHAEAGALLHSDPVRRRGGTLIVNGPPCLECARLIVSSGVARVVCVEDAAYTEWPKVRAFLDMAGVEVNVRHINEAGCPECDEQTAIIVAMQRDIADRDSLITALSQSLGKRGLMVSGGCV